MTNPPSAFGHIVTQLNALTAKLQNATTPDERRALLREYRALLERADRAASADAKSSAQ